jgi:acetylornithine/succinyldiaminopimelate/putrescine aminotransferase
MKKLLECYKKNPIIIKKGDGCYLFDTNDNKYLDMYSGICVTNLGHNPDGLENLVGNLTKELIHTSNYFYNENEIALATTLTELIDPTIKNSKIFFCNSGTEANEAALKFAILQNPGNILAFSGSYHGRTMGSLSCTYNKNYRENFRDYLNNRVYFWDWNVTENLCEFMKENNITIIIHEVVQGEGGVRNMSTDMISLLKNLHEELKFSWIIDEVQTGIGRCGKIFIHQKYNIHPDFVTIAKAMGNGIPIGAVICNSNTKIFPGLHGSTFGGNSFSTGVSNWVINKIKEEVFLHDVDLKSKYFFDKLRALDFPEYIKEIKGEGLLIGLEFHNVISVYEIIKELKNVNILSISSANGSLRICPPLIISKEEIDVFIHSLNKILENIKCNEK